MKIVLVVLAALLAAVSAHPMQGAGMYVGGSHGLGMPGGYWYPGGMYGYGMGRYWDDDLYEYDEMKGYGRGGLGGMYKHKPYKHGGMYPPHGKRGDY